MAFRHSLRPSSGITGPFSPTVDSGEATIKETPKARKLIVCIDGTSNQYSDKNTNVIELYSHIEKSDTQLTYYNSGIGTYAKPSWRSLSYLKQVLHNGIDLAIAWNLEKVIIGAYRWLSDNYRPGDQIFLFGFSRGAYQVRAIAGMIATVGLIFPGNQEQIPFAFELYASYLGGSGDEASNIVWLDPSLSVSDPIKISKQKVDTFKRTFSRPAVEVHFLGVWDTVSSIGIRRGRLLPLTNNYEHIKHFRHALALDERRVKFLPEHVDYPENGSVDENRVKEVWFAGTHSDIGGGNTRNLDLNRGTESLVWMMNEAEEAGLACDSKNLGDGVKRTRVIESLTKGWWALEVLPLARLAYGSSGKRTISRPHLGRGRKISNKHKIHYSVLANHLQVGTQREYKPKASYKIDGRKAEWSRMFEQAESHETSHLCPLHWEGDRKMIEALEIVREVNARLASESAGTWLTEVNKRVSDEHFAKMVWEYGSVQFLLKIARSEDEILVSEIVRAVLGMSSGLYTRDGANRSTSTLSVDPIISPINGQPHIPFPSTNPGEQDFMTRIIQDVIPRLPDLLICYKRVERRRPEDDLEANRPANPLMTRMMQGLKAFKNRTLLSVRDRTIWNGIKTRVITAPSRRGTAESTRNPSGILNDPPSLKLVQIALEIVAELAETGASADIAGGDIIQHIVLLLTIKQPADDGPQTEFCRLVLAALMAITKLSAVNERARSEFYHRRTASKVIALIKEDKKTIKWALRALEALAIDQYTGRNLREIMQDGFITVLKKALEDETLVSQAIQTIAAVAEDEAADGFLVEKGVIPQILLVLSSNTQIPNRKGAVRAIRRLSNNDTARSQLFENDAISSLGPLMSSSPDALCVVESLAAHGGARRTMIENGTLASVVSLIGSPAKYVSQRAMYAMAAFATHDEGCTQVIGTNAIATLITMLHNGIFICDVLEVVTRLAAREELRYQLFQNHMVDALLQTLQQQKVQVDKSADDNSSAARDIRTLQMEEHVLDPSINFSKIITTVIQLLVYPELRKQMLDLHVITILLELGTPRQLGKHITSPVVTEDIERSQEVLRCLSVLVNYNDTRLALVDHPTVLHMLGWLIDPQFRCPQLVYPAMSTLRAMTDHDDTLSKIISHRNIGEGVAYNSVSPTVYVAQEASMILGRFMRNAETQALMRGYLENANLSFINSRDNLRPARLGVFSSSSSFEMVGTPSGSTELLGNHPGLNVSRRSLNITTSTPAFLGTQTIV